MKVIEFGVKLLASLGCKTIELTMILKSRNDLIRIKHRVNHLLTLRLFESNIEISDLFAIESRETSVFPSQLPHLQPSNR
jgi:hypothetical protein